MKQNDAVDAILNWTFTFSKDDNDLGLCDLVERKIVTTASNNR